MLTATDLEVLHFLSNAFDDTGAVHAVDVRQGGARHKWWRREETGTDEHVHDVRPVRVHLNQNLRTKKRFSDVLVFSESHQVIRERVTR